MKPQNYYIKKLQNAYKKNKTEEINIDPNGHIRISFTYTNPEVEERFFDDITIRDLKREVEYRRLDRYEDFFRISGYTNDIRKIFKSIRFIGKYIKEFNEWYKRGFIYIGDLWGNENLWHDDIFIS